jgi:hypothetical protein
LLKREKRLLLVIIGYCHDNLVEQLSRALNHIEVAIGHRIKAAGVNCPSHPRKSQRNEEMKSRMASDRFNGAKPFVVFAAVA